MPPLACINGDGLPSYTFSDDFGFTHDDQDAPNDWSPRNSSSLYQIDAWGAPYFFVNHEGNIGVRPHGKATTSKQEVDLMDVIREVGDSTPVPLIIRFPDILRHRLQSLQFAFDSAIRIHNYQQRFQGVYPVKCNQDSFVVKNIVEFGRPYGFGFEAGSKPELLMAMSYLCKGSSDALLICNGYKDSEYIGLALIARKLGFNCVIVLEQEEEMELVMKISRQLNIQPVIGLRAKLNTCHGGHFAETSGEKGKFGLTCIEMLHIIQKLRRVGMLECLQLLHFHIGSQIPSLQLLNDGVTEAAHIYCELALMGANMKYIDVGGGLGIDYDGSKSATSDMSVAYTLDEYAEEVVIAVKKACMLKKVKQPILCSESGRALVSHHSVLVFNVFSSNANNTITDAGVALEAEDLPENLYLECRRLAGYIRRGDYESSLKCTRAMKMKAIELFKKGGLSLEQLAKISSTHDVVGERRKRAANSSCKAAGMRHLDETDEHTAVYNINLSVFKSMPDTWGIGQMFPILPIHRLEEQPTVKAIFSDLTCDSDGKVSKFIGGNEKMGDGLKHLRVHELRGDEPYLMGMFLGGAYQEALGGLHNMFGNPRVVHVVQEEQHFANANFRITRMIGGQTSADVLRCMHHEPEAMFAALKERVEECMEEGRFEVEDEAEDIEAIQMLRDLAYSFQSLPYLKLGAFIPRHIDV